MPYFSTIVPLWVHTLLSAVTECLDAAAVEVLRLVLQVGVDGINDLLIGGVALSSQILYEIREEVEVWWG